MFLDKFLNFKEYKTETTNCDVKLSSNESPYEFSDYLKDKIANAIKNIPLQRYPDPTYSLLKETLADFYNVSPKNITVGNGSDELIDLLIKAVGSLENPVMYPVPTFPMYQVSADIIGRPKIEFSLNEDFQLTKKDIEKALEYNPHIAFFASPNNPTGNMFDKNLIFYTAKNGVFTVIDEAYIHFSDENSPIWKVLTTDNMVIIRTMSKIGLAGIRLGVLIANEDIVKIIDKIRPPFNITYPTDVIARIVLTEGKQEINNHIQKIKSERERVIGILKSINSIKVYPSQANFFLIKVENANELHSKLIQRGILTRNMSHLPNLENCIRISIGKPDENDRLVDALMDIYK